MPQEEFGFYILSAKKKPLVRVPFGEGTRVTRGSRTVAFPEFHHQARVLAVAWLVYTSPYLFMQETSRAEGWIRDFNYFLKVYKQRGQIQS